MDKGAVLSEIQVPAIGFRVESLLLDSGQEFIVTILPLGSADNLSVAFGSQAVVVQDCPGVVRILLHVEGLYLLGIIVDENRPVILLGQERLVITPQIASPGDVRSQLVETCHGVAVGDPRERRLHSLQRRGIPLELLQLLSASVQCSAYNGTDEVLLQPHVRVGVVERHLRLDHPEFGQMPPGLRFLGSKGGTEAIDLPQGCRGGFDVKLSRLCQIGLPDVEVIGREQISRLFANGSGEDWGIDQNESALIEEISDSLHHLVAYSGHGRLATAPEPKVSMLEQESRPMFFRTDRIVWAGSQQFQRLNC